MDCKILKNGKCEITQNYGDNNHSGVDVVGENYTIDKVVAHSSGTVIEVVTGHVNEKGSTGLDSYGNYVVIDHGNNIKTRYAHLKNVIVKVGDVVKAGKILGDMGDSGNAYGYHLHFEVYFNGKRVNANEYINKDFEETYTVDETIKNKTTEELADEVFEGVYGDGEERRQKLGDRYREVQDLVNIIYKRRNDEVLLTLVKRTMRGDYGIGEERKRYLGGRYNEVQYQVNRNAKDNHWNWDNIRLY